MNALLKLIKEANCEVDEAASYPVELRARVRHMCRAGDRLSVGDKQSCAYPDGELQTGHGVPFPVSNCSSYGQLTVIRAQRMSGGIPGGI